MLRIILLIVLLYILYRLIFVTSGGLKKLLKNFFSTPEKHPYSPGTKIPDRERVIDEMKSCPQCGTYNPARTAFRSKELYGLYFCNERCHEAYLKEKSP